MIFCEFVNLFYLDTVRSRVRVRGCGHHLPRQCAKQCLQSRAGLNVATIELLQRISAELSELHDLFRMFDIDGNRVSSCYFTSSDLLVFD